MLYRKRRIAAHIIIFFLQIICVVYTLVLSYTYDMPANLMAGSFFAGRYAEAT